LGIADAAASKRHFILRRKFVAEEVASGAVELEILQLSELRLVPGGTVQGPLPKALQNPSVASAAVSSKARNHEFVRRHIAFVSAAFADWCVRDSPRRY
jgi:hypothetical protein